MICVWSEQLPRVRYDSSPGPQNGAVGVWGLSEGSLVIGVCLQKELWDCSVSDFPFGNVSTPVYSYSCHDVLLFTALTRGQTTGAHLRLEFEPQNCELNKPFLL
jgi:hypothetical protein